ncbi:hypothetical protein [Agromyces seonyuensis]|uniref:DUF8094 domain-containing protein n=1 Tax=Agromyces seonyuensis TaxID=2662446 RepID=A0A6I4NWC5_9MICO|nr:hypothetical protein [Agromyces seonyuensis]MWB98638.1 hypothetical protein [Agromyces seonyuensis]
MRFVLAIAAFLVAAVMIGLGIAERTVFLGPDRATASVQLEDPTAFVVLDGDALGAYDGKQTIEVSGGSPVFVSYGREADVEAWLGDLVYTSLEVDDEGELVSSIVDPTQVEEEEPDAGETAAPTETPRATPEATAPAEDAAAAEPGPSPVGSDLWLEEFTGETAVARTLDLPEGIAVLIATDGTQPAPADISVTWPLDNSTPWAGPLIVLGGLFFLAGLVLLALGFIQHRRGRGPRRRSTDPGTKRSKLPTGPRPKSLPSGRRSIGRSRTAVGAIVLVPLLALTGCSAEYWPDFGDGNGSTPTPTLAPEERAADAAEEAEIAPPAVTEPQLELIMARIAENAATADETLDEQLAARRFAGPALTARKTNYAIRKQLPDQSGPVAVSAGPLEVVLPQQSTEWPRSVFVVAKNGDDPTVPQTAMMLVQDDPRSNYHVVYAMSMAPAAQFPDVAPATVGAPKVSDDNKGVLAPPVQVSPDYADILTSGDASQFWPLFQTDGDQLVAKYGTAGQQQTQAESDATVTVSFATKGGTGATYALGTVDAGALVVGTVEQTEKAVPNEGGTVAFQEGGPRAALSGFTNASAKGVQHTTGLQVLYYVPGVGSDEQIRVLGWAESLIAASEVP